MLPPEHSFIENTLPAIRMAFEAGADIVEFDIHPTADGHFVVYHDWTLDCRTNGQGVTRERTLAELKGLDIGYGYTSDGGKTFPFRGKGIGMMPTLDEVLEAFPDKNFLINVKSNDPQEGKLLAQRLSTLPPDRLERLAVYGGDRPIEILREALPSIQTMSRASLGRCILTYIVVGWSGLVPKPCERSLLLIPINIAPWLWGWPDRFIARMERFGTPIFLVGPYRGGRFSEGLDRPENIAQLPPAYKGGISTDRIQDVGALLQLNQR